ncbi:MAG: MFS transporter, partial [Bacillota bacterium]|nr:MFS transporter [Bacillota bacterium]
MTIKDQRNQDEKKSSSSKGSDSRSNKRWSINTGLLLGSQAITMLGSSLVQYAIMWYIILDTTSGAMMTLYVIAGFLPHVLVSPIAGVLADRFDRKKIIISADLSIAGVTLILALVFLSGYKPYWLLFLASLLRSVGSGIQTPAVSAILPDIVPEEKLMRVGGINSSIQSLIFILAPACGGILLSIADLTAALFTDLFTAIIGVGVLLGISIPFDKTRNIDKKNNYWRDLIDGLKYVRKHQFIGFILIFYALFCVFISPISFLSPIFIARNFGGEVLHLTLQEVVFSSGSVLGGIA